MKIGFPFDEHGRGGVRSWVKTFGTYCKQKGHEVVYGYEAKKDVFINIANVSPIQKLETMKHQGVKIIQRMDGIYFNAFIDAQHVTDTLNEQLRASIKLSDLVIYQSKYSEELTKKIYKETISKSKIIYNGVDQTLFSPLGSQIPKETNKKIILSIAYWGTRQMAALSIQTIIDTARAMLQESDYEFWILGEAYEETEKLLQQANLPNITKYNLRTPVSHNDMPKYLRTADLILHTRPYDACSNLILEAMSVHKPVVGLDSGSTKDLLGEKGLVAKCKEQDSQQPAIDVMDLKDKILDVFDHYTFYKENSQQRSRLFTQECMSRQYLEAIKEVYDEKRT